VYPFVYVLFQNGFNPTWNETATFTLHRPDFAFFEFRVKSRSSASASTDGELLGSYVIHVDMMRTGYRHVYLETYAGIRLTPASLFVHVAIEDRIEDAKATRLPESPSRSSWRKASLLLDPAAALRKRKVAKANVSVVTS